MTLLIVGMMVEYHSVVSYGRTLWSHRYYTGDELGGLFVSRISLCLTSASIYYHLHAVIGIVTTFYTLHM